MPLTLNPDCFHNVSSTFENPKIAFFPDALDEKARDEYPNSVKKRILVGVVLSVFYGTRNVIKTTIRSFTDTSDLGPKLAGERTLIKDVIQGFLLFFAEGALRGTNEATLEEIVPC